MLRTATWTTKSVLPVVTKTLTASGAHATHSRNASTKWSSDVLTRTEMRAWTGRPMAGRSILAR